VAVEDIHDIEALTPERPLGVDFYTRSEDGKPCVGLKVWSHGRPIPLSERVPVLENMGFRVVDERTFEVGGDVHVWLHDMALERADGGPAELGKLKPALEAAFIVVMRGVAENDGYNALVIAAGLGWRDVALIRTVSRFLRQIRVPYSQDYMWATLRKHSALATKIVELFHARFEPHASGKAKQGDDDRGKREAAIVAEIEEALGKVDSLDEDRIVRRFVNAVQSAIRTNYYQIDRDGQPKQKSPSNFPAASSTACRSRCRSTKSLLCAALRSVHMRFGKVRAAASAVRPSASPH
jgi:glutamate dehydrogenase